MVLDPDPDCPAALRGARHLPGKMTDGEAIFALAERADILTVEVENVALPALTQLAEEGRDIIPSPKTLGFLINKLTQKQLLQKKGIAGSPFQPMPAPSAEAVRQFGLPCVQKAARGGYDGRGVLLLREEADLHQLLPHPGFVERLVAPRMELSVMVARDRQGKTLSWQPTEMVFHEDGNLLDYLIAPARISQHLAADAGALAEKAVAAIEGTGIFGVEMFWQKENTENPLLINEIAPRTHNSGHYTIEACTTSQFAQQYRILLGEPLGETSRQQAAVMFNLLGEPGFQGETCVEMDDRLDEMEAASVCIYGKKTCFPLRKMGHVTLLAETSAAALKKAEQVRPWIRIRGREPIEPQQSPKKAKEQAS